MSEINQEVKMEFKEGKRPIIVEIGPAGLYGSGTPASNFSRRIKDSINDGALYIGLDSKEEDLRKFMESRAWKYDIQQALVGDMAHLPLADGSADEIWLLNVFSNLDIRPEIQADGTQTWRINMSSFYKELSRVIKPKGEIIIGELGFPMGGIGAVDYLTDVDFEQFGLKKAVYRGENFVEGCKRLGIIERLREIIKENPFTKGVDPFFIILSKKL